MRAINHWLWAAGIALQCMLLIALLIRGIAPRFPAFTLLIAFYTVRSTILFALFGHIAPSTYRTLYNLLSPADILLQLMVAGELVFRGLQKRGRTWHPGASFIGLAALAGALTWSIAIALPTRAPVPLDRGAVFTSAVMVLLFLWLIWMKASRLPRSIAAGFAMYSAMSLMAEIARPHIVSARTYAIWSYLQAGTYLVVLFFWLLVLRDRNGHRGPLTLSSRPTAT